MPNDRTRVVLMAKIKRAPFKCSVCKKVFISDFHLHSHEERRHKAKDLCFSSHHTKEESVKEADENTMKAVLNATERIEDLLVKLSFKEENKSSNIPSTWDPNDLEDNNSAPKSSSTPKSSVAVENSRNPLSDYNLNGQLPKVCHEFLDQNENEVLSKITSASQDICLDSFKEIIPKVEIVNLFQNNDRLSAMNPQDDISCNETYSYQIHSRLKCRVIRKLNKKLESYNIDSNQSTLSDEEMLRIRELLKLQRDQIAEGAPEYYKLRECINENAERRIEISINSGISIT